MGINVEKNELLHNSLKLYTVILMLILKGCARLQGNR